MHNATISYLSTADDDRHATELQVTPDGLAQLNFGSNRAQRLQAVGRFAAKLPAELLQALVAAVADPAFAAAPSQAAMAPDEAYRRIDVRGSDGALPLSKLVGEQRPAAASFVRAEQQVQQVIQHTLRAPKQALALRMSPLPAQLRVGATLPVELQLGNVGELPLRLAAPQLWGRQATAATLQLLRADVASADLRPEHQRFIGLTAAQFVGADPAVSGDSLLLPPKSRVRLRFVLPVDWPVGRYRIDVDLEVSASSEAGQMLFEGGLLTEPVHVDVLGG